MKKLRVALIGYGAIGRVHALGYKAIPYHYGLPHDVVRVVAVATSHAETAEAAAREIGCEVWSSDYRDVITRDDVDIIDCCTPNGSHAEVMIAGAQAGKHLYCDKPLALGVAEGAQMVAAAQTAGVNTQMTFNMRFFPAIMRARQLMDEGFVGRIFSFRARFYRSSYIDPNKPLSWKLRRAESGGGALVDIGSHALDLVYSLLGGFDSVQAMLETVIKERPVAAGSSERVPVDVDDIAFMHLRTTSGAVGLVEASRLGTGIANELVIEIYGEKGSLRFDAARPGWLEVYDAREPATPLGGMRGVRLVETGNRYEGQKAPDWSMAPDFVRSHTECQYQFLKAISDDRPASPSFADGLHIQATMAAAQRSADEGRWVRVNEVLG
ncbi:MAG: Gfo/Idh/MocA family oxidoreductase [Anaerolineae bacterium]|nr:Gfo/Idh/MocA family oxidoreductase [Anaerolineae bacterium]